MPVALMLLTAVAIGGMPAARMLAAAQWPRRSPAAAIALWQALGLGWGIATVGALIGAGLAGHGSGAAAAMDLPRVALLLAGLALLALLLWIPAAAGVGLLRTRRRQLVLLRLLAHGDPKVPGALVVDHPAAAAYCVPGLRSAIVISAGTLNLLRHAELAAVLEHERAHLRARHDLVLLPFMALSRAFNWSATVRDANQAVGLLVEMLADDRARRHEPARELATALLRVGAAGGGPAPDGALAATGVPLQGPDGELAARVTRLLRPPPGLSAPGVAMLVAAAAALVIGPAAAMTLPL